MTDVTRYEAGRINYPSPFWMSGVGLPEKADDSGPFAVPWLFELSRYAGWLETVAAGNHRHLVPTCPGLTVGEVLRHLGVVHRVIGRWVEEGRRPSDVPGEPADGDLDRWFAEGWRDLFPRLAARSPDSAVATWSSHDNTIGFWRRRMAHETAIHALDVLASVPGHEDEWSVDAAMAADGIDEALRLWLGVRAGRDVGGSGQVVRIETSRREWTVALHADLVEVHELKASADARVSGEPDSIYAWLWGRSGEVDIDGDRASTDLLRNVLSRAMQ